MLDQSCGAGKAHLRSHSARRFRCAVRMPLQSQSSALKVDFSIWRDSDCLYKWPRQCANVGLIWTEKVATEPRAPDQED